LEKQRTPPASLLPDFKVRTQLFLINLITAYLTASSVQVTFANQQHNYLRATAFIRRSNIKAENFLKLRELPHLGHKSGHVNILQRENSNLYRR